MYKSNFELQSSLEIQLRESKEEIENLKRKMKQQELEYLKLEAKLREYKHESTMLQNESSFKIESNDKILTKLTDTTNISRVKILQLMHAVDDLTYKNTNLESYISRQDQENLQSNSSLLLRCQQLETLNVKLSLQDQMIEVQNEEISQLRRQLYDSKINLKTQTEKLEQVEINFQLQASNIPKLKAEISNLKTLNYAMSKSQTEKTLSIVPSSSSSPLHSSYSHRNSRKNFTPETYTINNSDLSDSIDSLQNSSNHTGIASSNSRNASRFFDPNMDELDDIYDVISKEVFNSRCSTKSTPNHHTANTPMTLPQLALEVKSKTAMYPNELSRPSAQARLLTR